MKDRLDQLFKDSFKGLKDPEWDLDKFTGRIFSQVTLDLTEKARRRNRLIDQIGIVSGLGLFICFAFFVTWKINNGWDPIAMITSGRVFDFAIELFDTTFSKVAIGLFVLNGLLVRGFTTVYLFRKKSRKI